MIHALKQLPEYYSDVLSGRKSFEIRKNDRPYKEGDLLALNEYDTENGYSGRSCLVYIDYVLNNSEYCKEGFVVMAIKPCLVGFAGSPRDMSRMCESYDVPEVENISERRFK